MRLAFVIENVDQMVEDWSLSAKVGAAAASAVIACCVVKRLTSKRLRPAQRIGHDFDVVIVGGSIAGPAMAKALSDQGRKVLLVERSLFDKPDRIVGELLQPGGVMALEQLGMADCAVSIGSKCTGYMVIDDMGKRVSLPYRSGFFGYSFHFGDLVNNLRRRVWNSCSDNVTMVEGIVTNVLTEGSGEDERAYGIQYTVASDYVVPQNPFNHPLGHVKASPQDVTKSRVPKTATAPLVILCDGGSSKFKPKLQHFKPAKNFHSNFVGLILSGITLPEETRGHVFFGKTGPILSYRLDSNEVRFLVDYNKPELPPLEEQSRWLIEDVAPRLPASIQGEFIRVASDVKNLRSMAVARYPQLFPAIKGLVGLGDHSNQRHPLTGGGMTCAFRDALRLAALLARFPKLRGASLDEMGDIEANLQGAINEYCRTRFLHSSCINILSWALYAVFGSPRMRNACFDYFLLGGDCVSGPMALLSGLEPSPLVLLRHYYAVMLNGAWNLIAKTGSYSGTNPSALGVVFNATTFFINPIRMYQAIAILVEATMTFAPLSAMEFVSLWRYVDSTSAIARAYRRARTSFARSFMSAKTGKPVGL